MAAVAAEEAPYFMEAAVEEPGLTEVAPEQVGQVGLRHL
jgi:hypothetical protein